MRFNVLLASSLAFAAVAIAAPTTNPLPRSLVTDLGAVVAKIEEGAGITAMEDELDKALGGGISKLEEKLGVSFAEDFLKLSNSGASPGDLQAVGKGIYYLEEGLGVNAIDKFLDEETGGAITSIEDALG